MEYFGEVEARYFTARAAPPTVLAEARLDAAHALALKLDALDDEAREAAIALQAEVARRWRRAVLYGDEP